MTKYLITALFVGTQSLCWADGGIDGGGGTLPTNPISINRVTDIIRQDAHFVLRLYFRSRDRGSNYNSVLDQKLFTGAQTVFDVLESTSVEVPTSKPCYDAFGKEVDGSIHASKPNAICISAFRIAPKLDEQRATPEILGLIAHELGHLSGATEDEAVAIQKEAVQKLSSASPSIAYSLKSREERNMRNIVDRIERLKVQATPQDVLSPAMKTLLDDFMDHDIYPFGSDYLSLLTDREYDGFRYEQTKVLLLYWYVNNPNRYESVFNNSTEVKLADIHVFDNESNRFAHKTYRKILSLDDLQQQLHEIRRYATQARENFSSRSLSGLPEGLPDPDAVSVNPWTSFIGSYNVTHTDCRSENPMDPTLPKWQDMTAIKIEEDRYMSYDPSWDRTNWVSMTESHSAGRPLYNGLYPEYFYANWPVEASETIKVSGDSNRATWFIQLGDMWNRMTRDSISLEKTSSGYEMKKTMVSTDSGERTALRTCIYQLQKQ